MYCKLILFAIFTEITKIYRREPYKGFLIKFSIHIHRYFHHILINAVEYVNRHGKTNFIPVPLILSFSFILYNTILLFYCLTLSKIVFSDIKSFYRLMLLIALGWSTVYKSQPEPFFSLAFFIYREFLTHTNYIFPFLQPQSL